ncbi:FtsW/RodA/SpoVE family cell cycle protein, partial [Streptomyces broussonetiae]
MTKAGTTLAAAKAPAAVVRLPRRRGIELALLVLAVLLCVYGYCAVGFARTGSVPPGVAGYGAGLGVLALCTHLAVRLRAPYADPLLLPIGVLLNGLGLVLIY